MRSLRRRLLVCLWLVVVVVGAASAIFVYRQAELAANVLLDDQLVQIAGFVVAQTVRMPKNRDDDESIEVAVWDADGHQTLASTPFRGRFMSDRLGFTRITLGGAPYRLYASVSNGRHIEVAQPIDTREDMAEAAALSALLPVVLLLPVLAIVIALVIRNLLQPVRAAAASVSQRAALASGALQTARLPSEIIPLVEEINRLLERQSAAVDRERQFIADAAHALRTPLAALQLQTDVLQDARTAEQREARLAELRDGIRRISRLGAQLLSLARLSMDATTAEVTDLDAACEAAARSVSPLCREKAIALATPGVTQLSCKGSAEQIEVVIGNLLDNAIRYTAYQTEVRIAMHADKGFVTLEITDQGPGLPEAELEKVFSRFYRGRGDKTEGSGLGLAIVRSIVQSLGGSVELSNRTGGGLRACVHVPQAPPPG